MSSIAKPPIANPRPAPAPLSWSRWWPAAVGVAALALGCTDPYSAQGLADHYVESYCTFLFKCCNASERLRLYGQSPGAIGMSSNTAFSTEDECREELHKSVAASFDPIVESVENGRSTWDAERARECFGYLDEGTEACDATVFFTGSQDYERCALDKIMTGQVAAGTDCYFDAECSGQDSFCRFAEPVENDRFVFRATGTCERLPQEGESCAEVVCAPGLYCDYEDQLCAAKRAVGQPCTFYEQCAEGYCDYNAQLCTAFKANGEPCMDYGECASGVCDYHSQTCASPGWDSSPEYDICHGSGEELLGISFAVAGETAPISIVP